MMQADPFAKRDVAPELRTPQAVNVLFLSICPLLLWFMRGSLADIVAAAVLILLFATARFFLIQGIIAEELFERTGQNRVKQRPHKLIGAGILGVATTALAAYKLETLLQPVVFGLATGALTVLIFGRDLDAPKPKTASNRPSQEELSASSDHIADQMQALVARVEAMGDAGSTRMAIALRNTVLAEQRALRVDASQLQALNDVIGLSVEDAADAVEQLETDVATAPVQASDDFALVMTEILEDFEDAAAQFSVSDGIREDAHVEDMLDRMDREFAA